MANDISWAQFDWAQGDQAGRQDPSGLGEDRIIHTIDPIPDPNRLELFFATSDTVTWWKSLQVRDNADRIILILETQDLDHGPKTAGLDVRDLTGARIQFHKAKAFGIHTGMYQLPPDLPTRGGRRIRFTWLED